MKSADEPVLFREMRHPRSVGEAPLDRRHAAAVAGLVLGDDEVPQSTTKNRRSIPDWRMMERKVPVLSSLWSGFPDDDEWKTDR